MVRGRSQLSTFMKAYTAYAFWWPPPPPQKRTLKCWFFSKSYLLTATCTIYTTHWSFHIYVNIIINKTIDIKNIHLFIIKLHAALHRSTLKRVKMNVASATCEGGRCNPRISWARWNRTFHCSVCSEYLTFYCRNFAEHNRWLMKYSQFGAILWTRISSSGENSVAPLCGLTETAVWRHCLRPKKAPFGRFRR